MFCLIPEAGDIVGNEYTVANTAFSWQMEQKLVEAPPLPFGPGGDGKLQMFSTSVRTRTNLLGLKTPRAKSYTDATNHLSCQLWQRNHRSPLLPGSAARA